MSCVTAAFRCSASRAPSIFVHVARQPLSCPLRASEIGEAYLIFLSAVLGVGSPLRRLLIFQYIDPNCFLRTGYLHVLADSVRAPTALFQVNLPALARSHSGVGDFHRALSLGSLFRCWVLGWNKTFILAPFIYVIGPSLKASAFFYTLSLCAD